MTIYQIYKQLIHDLKKYSSSKKKKPSRLGFKRKHKLTGRHLSAKYLAKRFEDQKLNINSTFINQKIQPSCMIHAEMLTNLLAEITQQKLRLSKYRHKTLRGILNDSENRVNAALSLGKAENSDEEVTCIGECANSPIEEIGFMF